MILVLGALVEDRCLSVGPGSGNGSLVLAVSHQGRGSDCAAGSWLSAAARRHNPYHAVVFFTRGQAAAGIESLLTQDRFRVQNTMPADLAPTPSYLAINSSRRGIAPERAERASWRVTEAHRFNVEPGFVLLGVAPPEKPGGWPMLLMAHDARDGSGTHLLGAWWPGPGAAGNAVTAFSRFVGRFGKRLSNGRTESLFFLRSTGPVPPQPAGGAGDIEIHALRQTQQFAGMIGWAWCFGIDILKYGTYLGAFDGAG